MLREDAHSRERNMLHSATALGARMSQATFFIIDLLLQCEYNLIQKVKRLTIYQLNNKEKRDDNREKL